MRSGGTWESVSQVLLSTIDDYGDNYQSGTIANVKGLVAQLEYGVTVPGRCMLEERSFGYQGGTSVQSLQSMDLTQIDPESIVVQWNKERSLYNVVFKSLPGKVLSSLIYYSRKEEIGDGELYPLVSQRVLTKFACSEGETSCTKAIAWSQWVDKYLLRPTFNENKS